MNQMNHIGERFLLQKIRKSGISGVKKYKKHIQRLAISPEDPWAGNGQSGQNGNDWSNSAQARRVQGVLSIFFICFMLEKIAYPKQNDICLANFSNAFKKVFHYVPLSFELTAFTVTKMRRRPAYVSFRILSIVLQKNQTIKAKFCLHLLATHISVY